MGREWQGVPISQPQLLQALEQTAIDQHPLGADGQQVFGAGDCVSGAKEGQLNYVACLRWCLGL